MGTPGRVLARLWGKFTEACIQNVSQIDDHRVPKLSKEL